MHKTARHRRIVEIISENAVANQSDLAAMLTADGFSVTQASVSRDLVELGVIKRDGKYVISRRPTVMGGIEGLSFALAGPNLIVGRCSSGMASAVTVRIDAAKIAEIVGTIAGDDTIFVAVDNQTAQKSVVSALREMFEVDDK